MALLVSKPGDAIANFRELMGPTNAEKARAQAPDRLATHAYPRVACDCVALTLPACDACTRTACARGSGWTACATQCTAAAMQTQRPTKSA